MISKFLEYISSLYLTVISVFLLSALVIAGTIYQANHGLYLAQEKFFNSYFFLLGGFLPIPSALTIMWILFFNLLASMVIKFEYTWKKFPLIFTHFSLLLLLISGFITFYFSEESFITIKEGERKNFSESYYDWQFFYRENPETKFNTVNLKNLRVGDSIKIENENYEIKSIFKNSRIFDTPFAGRILKELPRLKEEEQNIPALVLNSNNGNQLYFQGDRDALNLRRERFKLPVSIELQDVKRELHSGTEIAKAYSSKIIVLREGLDSIINFKISMNNPFRYKEYSFYQASYGIDQTGTEFAILAVVKNYATWLPYLSSILISLGLFSYFGFMLWAHYRPRKED